MATMNRVKTKLIILYGEKILRRMLDTNIPETLQEERVSLYHLMCSRKRPDQRTITTVQEPDNGTQTSTKGNVATFSSFLRRRYSPIPVDDDCVRSMEEAGHRRLPDE
jgi:hypothetical protein